MILNHSEITDSKIPTVLNKHDKKHETARGSPRHTIANRHLMLSAKNNCLVYEYCK